MSPIAWLLLGSNVIAFFVLPRRFAPLPLLIGALYVPAEQTVELGPISFSVLRILIVTGALRVALKGESIAGKLNTLDKVLIAWGLWACVSGAFHESGALENRVGMVCDTWGIYFLIRIFCQSIDDIVLLSKTTAIVLAPVALEMFYERFTMQNLFYSLNDIAVEIEVREGRVRANGPFGHAILAGTVGAVTLPLMIGLWQYSKRVAAIGIVACVAIVFSSASSSPIISCLCGVLALCMWRLQGKLRWIRWAAVFAYVALDIVMKAPAYYLLARIDVAGGSTGWHRARLIQAAFDHFGEWWLIGTDYTRHWIAYGVPWSPNHIDVTNFYLKMGVLGGLTLMLLHIAFVGWSFAFVGRGIAGNRSKEAFMMWSLGAAMFAHATTSIAVTYFDQSMLFFYLTPAAIASAWYSFSSNPKPETVRSTGAPRTPARVRSSAFGSADPAPVPRSDYFSMRSVKR